MSYKRISGKNFIHKNILYSHRKIERHIAVLVNTSIFWVCWHNAALFQDEGKYFTFNLGLMSLSFHTIWTLRF